MKSVLVRIQEYSAQASGAEKGVLRFLRENPEEAAGYSINQLADKTFSSAATIVRLCRKMGFDGYKELQKSLLYESALRRESTRPMEQEIKKDDSLEELVNKVTYKNIVSLDNTRKLVDLDILNQCVELLEPDRVSVRNWFFPAGGQGHVSEASQGQQGMCDLR